MSSILFIHGGDEFARETMRRSGAGYWASALPVALEKYGFVGVDVVKHDDLPSNEELTRYAALLIAPLPDVAWNDDLSGALVAAGRPALIDGPLQGPVLRLLDGIADAGPLPAEGTLVATDSRLRSSSAAYGYPPAARLGPGRARSVDRRPDLDWQRFPELGITEEQAAAWRRIGWSSRALTTTGAVEVLAELRRADGAEATPAIVKTGQFIACTFGLFGFIGQAHTSEPFPGGTFRNNERVTGAETMLLGLLDLMHEDAGVTRARVLPWPRGVSWVLNVRHDFDRALDPQRARIVLDNHARAGTRATWYWRARHLTGSRRLRLPHGMSPSDSAGRVPLSSVNAPTEALRPFRRSPGDRVVRLVASTPGHEVALHTELMWAGIEDERALVERTTGTTIEGSSAHGDPNCVRFQGAPNLHWAAAQGLAYTELISQAHFHPHRFVTLDSDGVVRPLEILCLPHHESFDRSTMSGDVNRDAILDAAPRWKSVSGLLQVMNHPDQNTEELFDLLMDMPSAGRMDLTAGEAARWWRATHVSGNALLSLTPGDGWELTTQTPVDGVVVELRLPDGSIRRCAVESEAGRAVTVWASEHRAVV